MSPELRSEAYFKKRTERKKKEKGAGGEWEAARLKVSI
jgi:hypothetical protein